MYIHPPQQTTPVEKVEHLVTEKFNKMDISVILNHEDVHRDDGNTVFSPTPSLQSDGSWPSPRTIHTPSPPPCATHQWQQQLPNRLPPLWKWCENSEDNFAPATFSQGSQEYYSQMEGIEQNTCLPILYQPESRAHKRQQPESQLQHPAIRQGPQFPRSCGTPHRQKPQTRLSGGITKLQIKTQPHHQPYQTPYRAFNPRVRPESPKSKTHNNKPYTTEQVDWMRYYKCDLKTDFKKALGLFWKQFPERRADLAPGGKEPSEQILSSRHYRDNLVPRLDDDGNYMLDSKGRLVEDNAKVRDGNTPQGREKDVPVKLVEKHPWRAINYKWVLSEHKLAAQKIMEDDEMGLGGKKGRWRQILRESEKFRRTD